MEWRGRRETEGKKKSLSLLLKPSSCAVSGSEMSDCTAGLLVFRECFAAFRDLILHCLRRRAASRCRRYFPPLCLVYPGSLFPSRIRGRGKEDCRARGKNKTHLKNPKKPKTTTKNQTPKQNQPNHLPPHPAKTSVCRICIFLSLLLLPASHSSFWGEKSQETHQLTFITSSKYIYLRESSDRAQSAAHLGFFKTGQ